MRNAIIIVSIVITVAIAVIVGLVIWHNKVCADNFEKAIALESSTRENLLKSLKEEDPGAGDEKIYASPQFETVIKLYEDVSRDCKSYSRSAQVSLERLRKAREDAINILKTEEEERKIAGALGIKYEYLKKFPEGARIEYFYGEGNQETIDFDSYVCSKYSDALHGEYQDVFKIELKSPLKEGPADFFITTEIIIPSGIQHNKYVSVSEMNEGETPVRSQLYLNFHLPEYIAYKGKKIFFKMDNLRSESGSIAVLDPLESVDGDRVKLLGRDIPVVKMPDHIRGGRVSIELNIVCHTVLR